MDYNGRSSLIYLGRFKYLGIAAYCSTKLLRGNPNFQGILN